MALSEFELKRTEERVRLFVESRRPPADIRHRLDIGFRIEGQSVVLFVVSTSLSNPFKKRREDIAKATCSKADMRWKIYWMPPDLKWQRYNPAPVARQFVDFLDAVDQDTFGCFWG